MINMFGDAGRERSNSACAQERRAERGTCYNVRCPRRNNYKGAWSCTNCYLCVDRKFTRQSQRATIES